MAEQALIADLRIGLNKFDADLKKAMQAADKASANISTALNRVDNSVKTLPSEFNKLNNTLRQTEQATNRAAAASEKQSAVMGKLKGVLGSLGLLVGAREMLQFAGATIRASEAMTGVEQQLTKLTGSTQASAKEMAFIRAETDRLALSTLEGAKAYARIANAAKGTTVAGEGVRRVFTAMNELTRANRLSTEQYGNIMNQVTQIISKGKIQTEELVTISENGIPAFNMLASAMGVTKEALADMLQAGSVSADNILLLADKIHEEYAGLAEAASSTIPAMFSRGLNQVKNEFIDLATGVLQSGELINAFKFESNILDIFPPVEVITAWTDEFIKQFTLLGELISTIFFGIKKVITTTFTAIVDDIKSVLGPIDAWIQDKFSKIPGMTKLKEWIGGGVQEGVDIAKKAVEGFQKDKQFQGLLATIVGVEGSSINERLEKSIAKLREMFGVKQLPLLDEGKTKPAAKKAVGAAEKEYDKTLEKLRKKSQEIAVLSDSKKEQKEAAKAAKALETEADHAAKTIKRMRDDQLREDEEREKKRLALYRKVNQDIAEQASDIQTRISNDAAAVEAMYEKAMATGKPVLEPIIDEKAQQRIKDFESTFENMKENIQATMASTISDAMRGDIDSIQDVADSITNIFVDTAANIASEFVSAMAIDPIMNQLKGSLAKMQGVQGENAAPGAPMSTGGAVMTGVGGVAGGAAVGMGVAKMAGGGKMGGLAGGAVGGAVAGATIGTLVLPGIGTAIGAAAGAIIGGVVGMVASKDKEKTSLRMQTTAGAPSETAGGASSRSPFGIISLFDKSKASDDIANSATMAISEIDAGIARLLDSRQREIVQGYFQSAVPEGLQVESKNASDAIAKAVQQRFFHAITALEGEETAKNVVGELYTANASSIQGIQARAMEALEILKTIGEFRQGPISETAQAIKGINQQFQDLIDRATVLGLPTEDIVAEQQRQLAEVTTSFNEDVGDRILAITDPLKLEFVQLERMQKDRVQNAIDAGANMVEVEKLNALEREQLAKQQKDRDAELAESAKEAAAKAAEALKKELLDRIEQFGRGSLSGVGQQLASLEDSFVELHNEAVAAGLAVDGLTQSYQQQALEIIRQARFGLDQAILQFADPFQAGMNQVNEQIREFQQLASEGIVTQGAVNQFRSLALANAQIEKAVGAMGAGAANPIEQIGDAFKNFIQSGTQQSQSASAMAALRDQFTGLAESAQILGLSTKELEQSYVQQSKVIRQQAIAAIDAEMQARRDSLKQIDQFLNQQRVSADLPAHLQFGAARKQFTDAVKGGNVEDAVSASSQYLDIAREQFGGTAQFFTARNEVMKMLSDMKEREARNIESERSKLIRQEERQLEQVQIGRSSVDYLRRISTDNSETSRGINQMIQIAKAQAAETAETRQLLIRLAHKIKA